MTDDRTKEIHLGDGLYASFDGFAITLRAPRDDGDHFVVLEPSMFETLRNMPSRVATDCLAR
jgi:hypothetical protein